MKKILVTGATGFCGRHLIRHYLKRSFFTVVGTYLDRKQLPAQKDIDYVRLDLSDRSNVANIIKAVRPAQVIHLAAQSIPTISWQRPLDTYNINTAGTLYLLQSIRRYAASARLLYVSSNQVYGSAFDRGLKVTEDTVPIPQNPYAASKLLGELACLNYHKESGLDVVIARPFNHIGVGMPASLVFSQWARQIVEFEKMGTKAVIKTGNLNLRRDFLSVNDVVKAYELLLDKASPGKIYNICSGHARPLRAYLGGLLSHAVISFDIKQDPKLIRRDDPKVITGDNKKMLKLGWTVKELPEELLLEIVKEWRAKSC